jgi:hypothetical protein
MVLQTGRELLGAPGIPAGFYAAETAALPGSSSFGDLNKNLLTQIAYCINTNIL